MKPILKFILVFLFVFNSAFFLFLFTQRPALAMSNGQYHCVSQPGMMLELSDGDYDYWIETPQKIVVLQTGSYKIRGKYIYFTPTASDIGDLQPSSAEIIDDCTIRWGKAGIFRLNDCQVKEYEGTGTVDAGQSRFQDTLEGSPSGITGSFPRKWTIYRGRRFAISIPEGCKVEVDPKGEGVKLSFYGGEAWIGIAPKSSGFVERMVLSGCSNEKVFHKSATTFYICGPGSSVRYVQVVEKDGKGTLVSLVRARDFTTFKALAIAVSSLKPSSKKGLSRQAQLHLKLVQWMPRDRSFSIKVPRGWKVSGGTVDYGPNGYVRIVQALSADESAGILGVYAPVYHFVRSNFGTSGVPPEDPVSYTRGRFLSDLYSNFNISFEDIRFLGLYTDLEASEKLNQLNADLAARMGFTGTMKMQVVRGKATYVFKGREYELSIFGVVQYTSYPLQGLGYATDWGPAPVFMGFVQKGELERYQDLFEQISSSWQVSNQWLSMHNRRAAAQARDIVQHYRRMSKIIHEGSERRMNQGLEQWEAEEHERMEEFWDTYYALGGEERYDHPETGEEIDVPTGADRYLYDNYSQTWVGIRDDLPDSQELVQHLKEKGFVELKKHTH